MALDRSTIIRTALTLLDELGLERLTLRRIANALDVRPPALYWHFASKQDLLDAMATTVLVDAADDAGTEWTALEWRELLRAYGHGLRRALLRHRDGAKMVPGTYLTDESMYTTMERGLRVLVAAGFTPQTASLALSAVYSYTVGSAIEEQAVYPRPGERDERYDRETRRNRLDPAEHPTVIALDDSHAGTAIDDRFERGLGLIVTGLEAELGSAPRPRNGRGPG